MPADGDTGAAVVLLALVLCEADVWLAPHPVSHAHTAKLRITTRGRIGGERMPLSCLASRLIGREVRRRRR